MDGSDPHYHFVYDEQWRIIQTYRAPGNEPDTDPKERFVYHAPGNNGFGTAGYIDDVILRERDANTDWDAESDGVLEQRLNYCQNWRHDLVAIVSSSGDQVEQVRYSSYGIPFGLPAGDTDGDGDIDAGDVSQISTWVNTSTYDVRGDIDLDGDVDATDKSIAQGLQGGSLGWKSLSLPGVGNRKGYAGYETDFTRDYLWHVRNRVLESELGRWTRRDPLGYVDGMELYQYVRGNSVGFTDPYGLQFYIPDPLSPGGDVRRGDIPYRSYPRPCIDFYCMARERERCDLLFDDCLDSYKDLTLVGLIGKCYESCEDLPPQDKAACLAGCTLLTVTSVASTAAAANLVGHISYCVIEHDDCIDYAYWKCTD